MRHLKIEFRIDSGGKNIQWTMWQPDKSKRVGKQKWKRNGWGIGKAEFIPSIIADCVKHHVDYQLRVHKINIKKKATSPPRP